MPDGNSRPILTVEVLRDVAAWSRRVQARISRIKSPGPHHPLCSPKSACMCREHFALDQTVKKKPPKPKRAKPFDVGQQVRLTTDLTRYHPSLEIGTVGVIVAPGFVPNSFGVPWDVQFPLHRLPVFENGLERVV